MFFQTGWIHFRYPSRKEAAEQRRGEEVFFKLNKKWNALDLTPLYGFPAGQLDFQLSVEFVGSRLRLPTGVRGNIGRTSKSPDAVWCLTNLLPNTDVK